MPTATKDALKLFELMRWVELGDGARYLSLLLGYGVSQDDVLRLALEGQLILSVRFVGAVNVLGGTRVPLNEVKKVEVPTLDGAGTLNVIDGTLIPGTGQAIVFDDRIRTICDVWDLPMLGGERLTVENEYERLHMREPPELFNFEGTFVSDSADRFYKLMERFEGERGRAIAPYDPSNFYPAAKLPPQSVLVLRTEVLRKFADRIAPVTNAKSDPTGSRQEHSLVGRRERSTLLIVIAALAKMAKVDVSKPSAAAAAVESETVRMGARVAARTIEDHLKRIPDALDGRDY